jgi:hypothetical protein
MTLLISGLVVLAITGVAFWSLLPRGGARHRWVETEVEPYISVALCGGIALSFSMVLSGVIDLLGAS